MGTYKIYYLNTAILLALFVVAGCGSVPPEFLTSMEKEREGINLLKERHKQTVLELVDNWYNERMGRLLQIKQAELNRITLQVADPAGTGNIEVLKKKDLEQLERQFDEAIIMANKIRNVLIEGYADTDNWEKLVKLNAINLDMTRSLSDLNAAQRKFYSDLVGKTIPFPVDFINDKTRELLNKP